MRGPSRPVFCLIVEPDPRVGLDLADALEAQGIYVAGPFRSGRDAARWLARFSPDVAVVDPALADGFGRDLVPALQARGIGVVVHSGRPRHGSPPGLPAAAGLWLDKPASAAAIVAALRQVLSTSLESERRAPLLRCSKGDSLITSSAEIVHDDAHRA